MYRDIAQWSSIRNQILRKGISIRQVVRETGISRETVRKMLDHPLPQPYGPRSHRYPKLGPHTASLRRMLQENATMPPSARLSIKAIYNRIRNEEGFRGSYGSVKDYARLIASDKNCIWEYAYDLLTSLEKKRAIDFLFLLSRVDPPVISRSRTERFFRDAGRVISIAPKPDRREQARQAAFEWMRRHPPEGDQPRRTSSGDRRYPRLRGVLDRLYDGRLSDRNRSMAVLANRRGLSSGTVCGFLGINKQTYRKYLRTFKNGGHAGLFARQTKSTRKFDNEAVKQAVFGLLHEPPSNYGINRTTWIMPDLSRVLRETGQPACPDVIRKITKAAGYRWRKARVVLTSTDPTYIEKLGSHSLHPLGPAARTRLSFRSTNSAPSPSKQARTYSGAAWSSTACPAVAEVARLHDHDGSAGVIRQSGHAFLQHEEEHRRDDPHDGGPDRKVRGSAEALSLLGCGVLAHLRTAIRAHRSSQRSGGQWTRSPGRDGAIAGRRSIPERNRVRLQRHGARNHPQQ